MNAGRLVYKTILQINKQYSSSRLPLTGIVGFSQSRFRYPVSQAVKEAFNAQRDNPDLDCKCAVQRHMLSCFCSAFEIGADSWAVDMQPGSKPSNSCKLSMVCSLTLVPLNRQAGFSANTSVFKGAKHNLRLCRYHMPYGNRASSRLPSSFLHLSRQVLQCCGEALWPRKC